MHQRLLRVDHPADDAFRETQREAGRVGIAHGVADAQLAALLVEQIHGERVERNQPADQLRNALQQLVEVDDRGDLAAQVEQSQQDLALAEPETGEATWTDVGVMHDERATLGIILDDLMHAVHAPLDYAAIERILPHRYPFLLVDRVTEFEPDRRIVGIKNVSLNERYLWHGPGRVARCCRRRS